MRFQDKQVERLDRVARRLGRTASETGALFVEEGVRRSEFAYIDFRDSGAGRQAYIQGTSLAVWEVVFVARSYDLNLAKTAEHLDWPEARVQAALNYAAAFPEEIETAISDNAAMDFTSLSRMLPQAEAFEASA
jgi:uncharacterized protein (DUF433 family)